MKYARIMSRVLNRPLLMMPDSLSVFISALSDRIGLDRLYTADGVELDQGEMRAMAGGAGRREQRSYMVDDGIAILPVIGTLVNKSGSVQPISGMTGYDSIEARMWEALEDDAVHTILLDIDSPGGEVSGCFDLTDMIYDANSIKPVVAFAGELAASAAYAVGSAASALYLPRTGTVGSVGVVTAHQSYEKALDKAGIEVTIIHAGDKKVDGNPYEALPDEVRAEIQASVDDTRQLFASRVAEYRGMSLDAVMATEAGVFNGQAAVDAGFADGVMSYNEVLAMLKGDDEQIDTVPALAALAATVEAAMAEGAIDFSDEATKEWSIHTSTSLSDEVASVLTGTEVVEICEQAGMTSLAVSLIKQQVTAPELELLLQSAEQIKDICLAADIDDSPILGALGNPVEMVRQAVLSLQDEEIDHTQTLVHDEPKTRVANYGEIWQKRKEVNKNGY